MLLRSPPALHYPITVTELLKRPQDTVRRSAPLFRYYFKSVVAEDNEDRETREVEKTFPTLYESEVEGKLLRWKVQKGSVIAGPNADLAEIEEPCRHDVQYGGMCVNCGRDLTETDYNTTVPDTQRADTGIAHVNNALKISREEAARIDEEAKQRLLNNRKLSLVVDLDLTVIHASVDPTVGEWQNEEGNPNYEALKDVKVFELYDEAMRRPVSYYIKLRPGLAKFLENISKMYEMHIYTMATRSYAGNVARIIDPDETLFGDRIMSRSDTPGEEHRKNINKLFPVDNRMVVIIDDRADVWGWSKYLLRVKPFNFFIGIGDINSSFLPKQEEYVPAKSDKPVNETNGGELKQAVDRSSSESSIANGVVDPETAKSEADSTKNQGSTLDQIVSMQDNTDSTSMQQKTAEQDEALAVQMNERPLLQQQKLLEEVNEARLNDEEGVNGDDEESPPPKLRQNLLQNDDTELARIEESLTKIHTAYYQEYDEAKNSSKPNGTSNGQTNGHQKPLKPSASRADTAKKSPKLPDVKDVMNPYRTEMLRDCHLVFSGIVPLGLDALSSHFARMALRLGATVESEISKLTTHVIARRGDPTSKMRQAAANPRIKLVSSEWLWESSASWWKRIDETPYLIDVPKAMASGVSAPEGSRSEAEALDEDDDDTALGPNENTEVDGQIGTPVTPIDEYNDDDWADIQNQIDEMESDSDEDNGDGNDKAMNDDDDSSETEGEPNNENIEISRKRKRDLASENNSINGDAGLTSSRVKRPALNLKSPGEGGPGNDGVPLAPSRSDRSLHNGPTRDEDDDGLEEAMAAALADDIVDFDDGEDNEEPNDYGDGEDG